MDEVLTVSKVRPERRIIVWVQSPREVVEEMEVISFPEPALAVLGAGEEETRMVRLQARMRELVDLVAMADLGQGESFG